jgi:hypothetical protein
MSVAKGNYIMRSVSVFFKEEEKEKIVGALNSLCSETQVNPWVLLNNGDAVLYINIDETNTILSELEKHEADMILEKLSSSPLQIVVIDISGRYDGRAELLYILTGLLRIFEGVVTDDYFDYAWTINEILDDNKLDIPKFFTQRTSK